MNNQLRLLTPIVVSAADLVRAALLLLSLYLAVIGTLKLLVVRRLARTAKENNATLDALCALCQENAAAIAAIGTVLIEHENGGPQNPKKQRAVVVLRRVERYIER